MEGRTPALTGNGYLETAFNRQMRYCRRRAAIGRPVRSKACRLCSRTKAKCDSKWPCSRCVSRNEICSYSKPHGSSARAHSINTHDPLEVSGGVVDLASILSTSTVAPDDLVLNPTSNYSCFDGGLLPAACGNLLQPTFAEFGQGLSPISLHFMPSPPEANLLDTEPDECRRLVLSVIGSYPYMMTQPDNLPPFVHPVACGLHFDGRESIPMLTAGSAKPFDPLKPLAACIGIAHAFASRTANTEEFLWRTIASEERYIQETVSFNRTTF